ncbi:nitrilase-related carbon-nitrogen hydrolase [Sporomusa sp.]|uniref:nitrilase-related carbon-nitrogen hydrolase n=1 Tax=Sporomusa sp. TaxID=2078658 RepID=UPI002C5A27F8|nr:nitrilase-related carbon-nitrogen hydrolase [Sporomusa sp.]HWR45433.1 nitrilase-related carbon-nitrogen hydrolase [Sporomusa sp.]
MPVLKHVKRLLSAHPLLTAAGISSTLFFYSTGFYDYWLLTWLAPLPVCLYALQAPAKNAALAAFIAHCIGALNQIGYLPIPVFAGTTGMSAAAFATGVMLFRCMAQSGRQTVAPFVFAGSWTTYEFIRSLLSSFGTFDSLAYTQVLNLPIIQMASVTGIWGITFLLMLLPSSLAILWCYRRNWSVCRLTALLSGSLFALVLLFGVIRLYTPADGPGIKIGLATIPTTRELLRSQDAQTITDTLRHYSDSVNVLADSGARFILLPEKLAAITPATRPPSLDILSAAARKNNVTLIAGLSNQEDNLYNSAFLFSPDGALLPAYHKQHLLPAYESRYTPGTSLVLFNITDASSGGLAICKDMDFGQPAREYSRQGAGILFVPALDFHEDGWLHARIAVMRGVEGDYAVARTAQWGLLTISDSRGRIIGLTAADTTTGEASLLKEVTMGEGRSFYSRTGDWLAWLCLLITITAVI